MKNTRTLSTWKAVINKSNIGPTPNEEALWDDKIKSLLIEVFEHMQAGAKEGMPEWSRVWEKTLESAVKKLRDFTGQQRPGVLDEDVDRVCNKFKGNALEIFAEAFTLGNYLSEWDVAPVYNPPEDPLHEERYDASTHSASNPEIPMNIQVKNWSNRSKGVGWEVIEALEAVDDRNRRKYHKEKGYKCIEVEEEWESLPRQIIFSSGELSPKGREALDKEEHSSIVAFVGPRSIGKKLGPHPIAFFKNIVNELKNT